jgi:hypothetical protein
MWRAARATSAAPTYFEPVRLAGTRRGEHYALVDGGVFANNPAMCAFAEARRRFPDREPIVVSLGTGEPTRTIAYDQAKDWGLVQWARPLIDVVFDGGSQATEYQLEQLLDEGKTYFRLQVGLETGFDDLDDASATNLAALRGRAEELIAKADREGTIDEILDRLTSGVT